MASISPDQNFIKTAFNDLAYLLFPPVCICCGRVLVHQEERICYRCLVGLPRTNFHLTPGNEVEMMFWGRVKLEKAASFFYFQKGARHQTLLHALKYKGMPDIGVILGRLFASELKDAQVFQDVDVIVPVPLHPKKEQKRGYNQSQAIAEGISEIFDKPIDDTNLYRQFYSETQTRKGRWERWQNVESLFQVKESQAFEGKHVLLVDDVVTTGSTLEAGATELLKSPDCRVSLATLAYASM